MCGIAGVISLQTTGIVDHSYYESVKKMLEKMFHRGPDESNAISGKGYSIGTTRLKMVGDEQGKQPLKSEKSALIFNGEIYNYKNIAKDYLNNNLAAESDSYVLFQFLNEHGLDKINILNGMFSFCYVDKNFIYLVRDRFGEKPLYFTIKNNQLFFASEIKAFVGLIDFQIKLPKFYSHLETPLMGETIFEDIFEVVPSTYIKIDRKNFRMTTHQYFSIFDIQMENGSEDYLKEKLRFLVDDAINIRKDTALPYGVFISGGLDSSIVALLTKPDYLLTYLPKTDLVDSEEKYADIVASLLPQSRYLKILPSEENFLEDLIKIVSFNGGPTTTLAAYSQYQLSKALHSENIRLAFSGLGVDEFFNGYIRHAISLIPRDYFRSVVFQRYGSLIEKISANQSIAQMYSRLLNRSYREDKEFIELINFIFSKINSNSTAMSICDAFFTLPPLLHTDDHLNMAFGIESRAPFLDYRLVGFALGLPEKMKVRVNPQGEVYLKYLLREAFKDILPKEIYTRNDKVGFSSNTNNLLRNHFSHIFNNAEKITKKYIPETETFWSGNNSPSNPYIRWEYQVVQLAITYLLYCGKYNQKDVKLILSKGV